MRSTSLHKYTSVTPLRIIACAGGRRFGRQLGLNRRRCSSSKQRSLQQTVNYYYYYYFSTLPFVVNKDFQFLARPTQHLVVYRTADASIVRADQYAVGAYRHPSTPLSSSVAVLTVHRRPYCSRLGSDVSQPGRRIASTPSLTLSTSAIVVRRPVQLPRRRATSGVSSANVSHALRAERHRWPRRLLHGRACNRHQRCTVRAAAFCKKEKSFSSFSWYSATQRRSRPIRHTPVTVTQLPIACAA